MRYEIALLLGRAFALANGAPQGARAADAADELCQLARGRPAALELARSRYAEFVLESPPSAEDREALALLERARERAERERAERERGFGDAEIVGVRPPAATVDLPSDRPLLGASA